jgi:Leucine-rich repeat (LRR) protein
MLKLLLVLLSLSLFLDSSAMHESDAKKVKFAAEEKPAEELHLEVEVRIVLTAEEMARIQSFGNVVCANIPLSMRNVTILSLEGSKLKTLPRGFDELKALKKLCLRHNALPGLFPPKSKWSFPLLEELDICDTQVGTKPVIWSGLFILRKLTAQRAGFRQLDNTIANLKSVESLDFSYNELTSINSMVYPRTTLTFLNFAHNHIKRLSAEISNLHKLEELYLDSNELEEIPEALGSNKTLRVLSLSRNRLSSIPESCAALTALRLLNVAHNRIAVCPAFITAFKELQQLSLHSNEITEFPLALVANLPGLHKLTISQNPIVELAALQEALSKLVKVVV